MELHGTKITPTQTKVRVVYIKLAVFFFFWFCLFRIASKFLDQIIFVIILAVLNLGFSYLNPELGYVVLKRV